MMKFKKIYFWYKTPPDQNEYTMFPRSITAVCHQVHVLARYKQANNQ